MNFAPAIEASSRTNQFFLAAICKRGEKIVNAVVCAKIDTSGIEKVDEFVVATYKFASLFSLRSMSRDKVDYVMVGGNRSVLLIRLKDGKLSQLSETVFLHSGPVIDMSITSKWMMTACLRDSIVQVLSSSDVPEGQAQSLPFKLLDLLPKLACEYDGFLVEATSLRGFGPRTRRFTVSLDCQHLYLVLEKGICKMSIGDTYDSKEFLQDRKLTDITAVDSTYYMLDDEAANAMLLVDGNMHELKKIQGKPYAPPVDRYLKHSNSALAFLWMKERPAVEAVNTSDFETVNIDMKLPAEFIPVLVASTVALNVLVYARSTADQSHHFLYLDSLKRLHTANAQAVMPDVKVCCLEIGNMGGYALVGCNSRKVNMISLGTSFQVIAQLQLPLSEPVVKKTRRNSIDVNLLDKVISIKSVDFSDTFVCVSLSYLHVVQIDGLNIGVLATFKYADSPTTVQDAVLVGRQLFVVSGDQLLAIKFV